MDSQPLDFELVLSARPENVGVVRHVLGGLGQALGLEPTDVANLRLAVSEACTNVVVHAYEAGSSQTFVVAGRVENELLNLTVRDHGTGVSLQSQLRQPGLGVPLASAVATSFEMKSSPDGNVVEMSFLLPRDHE